MGDGGRAPSIHGSEDRGVRHARPRGPLPTASLAHLAFIAPPFLGHLNPMRALARALTDRGHRATVFGVADSRPLIADDALGFHPIGRTTHPPGHLAAMTARMAMVDGVRGLAGIIADVAAMTSMLVDELPGALRAERIDLVLCDGTEAAGGLVADHLGLPFATVANALPLNREPGVPPAFTGWRYDPSPWGIERNRGGYRVADWLMRGHGSVIAAAAARWRLGTRETVADCLSPWAQIGQTVAGFDFPRRALSEAFHHVGPLRRRDGTGGTGGFTLPVDDGRPLAYASLGTLQGGRAGLFRTIAGAVDRLGWRLVLAHGGRLDAAAARALPGRPAVHAFVPQAEVLRHARVAILNGGLNTVMDALAEAVPIVALPIAFEQGAIAARLARAGAGRVVGRRLLTRSRLAAALKDVLDGERYRVNASRLAGEIAAAGGVERAADIVDDLLRTGRPVLSEGALAARA